VSGPRRGEISFKPPDPRTSQGSAVEITGNVTGSRQVEI